MRIGLLSNLSAGANASRAVELLDALRNVPGLVHVETNRSAAAPDALHTLAQAGVDLLLVNGGDGTLQNVLTAVLGQDVFDGRVPLIAPLRGGRTNTSALDVGASRDPIRAALELCKAIDAGRLRERIVKRRVLRIELREGPKCYVRYGMFFGAGVIHRGIELVQQRFPSGKSQGVFGAGLVTAGLLARLALGKGDGILAGDKIQMLVDGVPVERGESRLVMASTQERLFLGLRPFWGRGPGAVRFTAISSQARGLARAAAGILRGRPGRSVNEERGYLSRNADRVALLAGCGLTIDGELIGPRPGRVVSITADRAIEFVRA